MHRFITIGIAIFISSATVSAQDFNVAPTSDGQHAWRIKLTTGEVSYCVAIGLDAAPTCSPWSSEENPAPTPPVAPSPNDENDSLDWMSCSLEIPAGAPVDYYTNTDNVTAASLRARLSDIINTGTTKFSYKKVWDQLKFTDEDPCNTDNVLLLYTGRSQDKDLRDQGQNDPNSWNREHVWAKSHGFPAKSQTAYTDIHHLRPADRSVNSSRSDRDFDDGGTPQSEAPDTFKGDGTWEPREEVKGDVARMVFYMDVRYEGQGNVPDLKLVKDKTSSGHAKLGSLCTLLKWHKLDPVDTWERRRNTRTFTRQGNRNPFIDHPEWVDKIYSSNCE